MKLDLVRHQQVGVCKNRRAAHVATAVHEHRNLIQRVDVGADRRAAADVDWNTPTCVPIGK